MNYYDASFRIARKENRPWTKRDVEALIQMRSQNMSMREIGEQLGRSKSAICGFVFRARQSGGLGYALSKAPANPFERQFTTKITVKPEQYRSGATCFRCGARSGLCEHTEGHND